MENRKVALITGINGQTGSYLAEFLLDKGYEVWGIIKRNSVSENQTVRIDHIMDDIKLEYGDMTDMASLIKVLAKAKPDEIYNLAAQSHVRISFDQPMYTANATGLGVLNLLEAIRIACPEAKMYQASSSEMFGNNIDADGFQRETTPLNPVSPYGCAKVYGYNICRNYRNAYGMFVANGILFNHECVSENTPITIRNVSTNIIEILRVRDLTSLKKRGAKTQQWVYDGIEIWDGGEFVALNVITATKRPKKDVDYHCRITNTRNGIIETTNHHNLLDSNGIKVKTIETKLGDTLLHGIYPKPTFNSNITESEAKLIGFMVADGSITNGKAKFTNNDIRLLSEVEQLWVAQSLGYVSYDTPRKTEYGISNNIRLNGNGEYLKLLESEIYNVDGFKQIPKRILNANESTQMAFLEGYNLGDGLKSNDCVYKFKNFKTNSNVLANGLLYLISNTTKQEYNITFEEDDEYYGYYSINLLSDSEFSVSNNYTKECRVLELVGEGVSQREISRDTGISRGFIRKIQNGGNATTKHHLSKNKQEIKKCVYHNNQPEWVFDLNTDTGKFMGGVGNMVVANSPRRGINFVTNKVVKIAVEISLGMEDELVLGNLDATRDWGHAQDYCKAMWLMLQHDKPDDFVCATGISHSVKDLVEYVFEKLGLDWEDHVRCDSKFLRPEELKHLKGDSIKAKERLGWEPEYTFETMLDEMIEYWIDYYTSDI